MDGPAVRFREFLQELRDRRVLRVAAAYAAISWVTVEAAATVFPLLDLPEWSPRLVLVLVLAGFPLALVLAWSLGGRAGARAPVDAAAVAGAPAVALEPSRVAAAASPGVVQRGVGSRSRSVLVLPFRNLGAEEQAEFICDGLTEDVITDLSRIPGLRVASRTTTNLLRTTDRDVRTLGADLEVRYVLEGTVRLAGNRLRVTAQLVDAMEDSHLWADRFDSELSDIFAIESNIAHSVAAALSVVLRSDTPRGAERPRPRDIRAYEHYVRGRQFFYAARRKSLEYARSMFTRAVEIDPGYALAYAGIADANSLLCMYYPAGYADMDAAERASRRALELAPGLAEVHSARGAVLFLGGSVEEAEREFRLALRLDAVLFEAHYMYGRMCFQLGRFAEAAVLFEAAHAARDDYQAAFFAAQSYEALGETAGARSGYAAALDCVTQHMELNPDDPRAATMRAVSLVRLGCREEGLGWATRALVIDPDDAGVRYNVACLFAVAGEVGRALDCLEEAFRVGFGNPEWLQLDPDLASLRDDPRFQRLLATAAPTAHVPHAARSDPDLPVAGG